MIASICTYLVIIIQFRISSTTNEDNNEDIHETVFNAGENYMNEIAFASPKFDEQ